jgi:hypothetical protein
MYVPVVFVGAAISDDNDPRFKKGRSINYFFCRPASEHAMTGTGAPSP